MSETRPLSTIPAEVAVRVKAGGWSDEEEAQFKAMQEVRTMRVRELALHTDQCLDEADLKMLHLIEQHAFWNSLETSATVEKVAMEDGALVRARDCAFRLVQRLAVMCPDLDLVVTRRGRIYAGEKQR